MESRFFLTIVQEGSMRAAAEVLGVGAPAITLQLKSLEERLGTDLLFRTTRNIKLTEAGRVLFEAATPAHRDLAYAIKKTQEMSQSATGTLRLSMSRGAYLASISPILGEFLAKHPGINLDISWNEELVDIVRSDYHAGIRMGDLLTPEMIAVRITPPIKSIFFASPDYIKNHGQPETPRDLLQHKCIRYRQPTSGTLREWQVEENGQDKSINPPLHLTFDSVAGVIQSAREGHGVGWSMRTTVQDCLDSGELEALLEPYVKELPPFYIYYPEQNRRVECLRLFVEFLKSHLKRYK